MQNLNVLLKNICNFFVSLQKVLRWALPVGFCSFRTAEKVFSVKSFVCLEDTDST